MNDLDTIRFYNFQAQPLLVHLYMEAKLQIPTHFDYKIEGPRLVAALREQGFSMNFKLDDEIPNVKGKHNAV